jgi:predicted exporter
MRRRQIRMERKAMVSWAIGAVMAVLAVVGLFLASGAQDSTMEWVGLLLTIFGIGYIYRLIIENTGK